MFVQELLGSALRFDAPRAEKYRQLHVLSDQGWETLEDYAALGCEKLEEACFPPPRKENPRCLLVRLRFWDLATI